MKRLVSVLAVAAFLVVAVQAYAAGGARHASAVVVNASGDEIGFARFTEDATGRVHVNVHVKGLSEGLHGIHLHAVGLCAGPLFTSAGSHFNPTGAQHGHENPNGPHAGDLPNLVVNKAGVGHLNTATELVSLSPDSAVSLFDANGTALIIHAGADDQVSDPTGNSGGRVACGVITPN